LHTLLRLSRNPPLAHAPVTTRSPCAPITATCLPHPPPTNRLAHPSCPTLLPTNCLPRPFTPQSWPTLACAFCLTWSQPACAVAGLHGGYINYSAYEGGLCTSATVRHALSCDRAKASACSGPVDTIAVCNSKSGPRTRIEASTSSYIQESPLQ
jgi:hypothetical protein